MSSRFSVIKALCAAFLFLFLGYQAAASSLPAAPSPRQIPDLAPEIRKNLTQTGQTEVLLSIRTDDLKTLLQEKGQELGLHIPALDRLAQKISLYTDRKHLILEWLAGQNFQVLHDYEHLPFLHLQINGAVLDRLLQMPEVAGLEANRVVSPHLLESLPLTGATETHTLGVTGLGTAVAVLDTGVDYTLPDFGSCSAAGARSPCKVVYVQDFAPDDGELDDQDHGTNVAGIVAGNAPGAEIISLDVFRPGNEGASYGDILAAIDWVIGHRDTYNIVAANMSFGGGEFTGECANDILAQAVQELRVAGIVSTISAGNEGLADGLSSPACAPAALSVGAVYDADFGGLSYGLCADRHTAPDQVACFSNSSANLKILAPGATITAAGITMLGTSQAAPQVAGAVALLKEADPSLTVDEIVARLTSTGIPVIDPRNGLTTPRVDVFNALTAP